MPTAAIDDGCFIYGLYLEAADWSDEDSILIDSDTK